MKQSYGVVILSVFVFSLLIQGCVSESSVPVTAPSAKTAPAQRATITGKIFDGCTMNAINGAVLSVGYDGSVGSVTSDASGSFSFANVPVGQYTTVNGNVVGTGTYKLTASMVAYNGGQKDSTKRYRDFYYSNVTITFTSVVDSTGLLGFVGSINFVITTLNTQVKGVVVDPNIQPVANAQVTLFDQTVNPGVALKQTTTSANGTYVFNNVDNGITVSISARSWDGTLQGNLNVFALPCNVPVDSLRPQFTPEQLMVAPVDNVSPFVIAIAPQNNADVSPTNLQIIYVFSEPIKQASYTRTTLGFGHGTIIDNITVNFNGLKKAAATVPFAAAWDSTFTRLTITPQGIVGSAKYTLNAIPAFNSGNIKDLAGNALVNNPNIVGDFEALNFTTGGGSTIPSAPTLVRSFIPGTFDPLNFGGGNVGLSWNYDPNARSYNVYKSIGNGSFTQLATNVLYTKYTDNSGVLYTGVLPNPYAALTVSYEVIGVSKDLVEGSASNVITVGDQVKPKVVSAQITIDSTSASATGNNVYYVVVPFNEPMAIASVENSPATTYTFSNTLSPMSVSKADYTGLGGGNYNVRLTVGPLGGLRPNGPTIPTLVVQNTATDLAGNALDVSGNANVHQFSAYFYDGFDAPWTNSGQTPAGWTRTVVSGTANWSQKSNPLAVSGRGGIPSPNAAVDGNSAAFFPSDATAGSTTRIESPAMDLSNSTTPVLYLYYVNSNGTDVVNVRYSNDNGTSWNTLTTLTTSPSTAWQLRSISLAALAGQKNILLGFEAVSDGVAGNPGSDIWIDGVYVRQ